MRRYSALVVFLLISGCSSTSFLGGRYDDFTAFYNTFYNAERAFDKGVKAVRERAGGVDRQVYRPVFPVYDAPSTAREFEEAIRKSADVLRDHGSSKWVDDALLLIGKSYFYQQNYFAAQEKFREVVVLGTRREDEARYWLARTLLASNSYDELSEHLLLTSEREKKSKKWNPYLLLIEGELAVRKGDLAKAVGPLELGARAIKDRQLENRAHYLLGQIHESLAEYDEALASYKRAQRKNSDFDLVYASQVGIIRVESVAGNPDVALRDLRKMERDDKNFDQVTDLRALRGRILLQSNDVEGAIVVFEDVLRSQDRVPPEVKGDIHYQLASIYRDVYRDYSSAAAHFDTAATSLQVLIDKRALDGQKFGFADPFVPWAITDSRQQKEIFGTFDKVASQVAEMDSLLYLGSLDDDAFKVRIAEIRRQRREELSEIARKQQQRQIEEQFRAGGSAAAADARQGSGGKQIPSTTTTQQTADAARSGFLYNKDPTRVQEGFRNFVTRWGERPLVPGWRLSSKLLAASAASGDVPDKQLISARRAAGNLLGSDNFGQEFDDVDVDKIPRTEETREAMRTKRAEARYQVGTVLFLSMNRPDSAATWFRKVITEDADEPIAPKAYYALAEVNRALGDDERADELMNAMNEQFPDHGAANEDEVAKERLAAATIRAEHTYANYYEAWQNRQYPTAAVGMLALAEASQPTPVAPQALYAAGSVLLDWARSDQRSPLEPFALPIPDSVAAWLGIQESDKVTSESAGSPQTASADTSRMVLADTLAAVDTLAVPPGDGLAADSVDVIVPDSVAVISENVPPDSVATSGPKRDSVAVTVETVLNLLSTRYSTTAYAKLARTQLEMIGEMRAREQAAADSVAAAEAVIADSIAALSATLSADSSGVPAQSDSAFASPKGLDGFPTADSTAGSTSDTTAVIPNASVDQARTDSTVSPPVSPPARVKSEPRNVDRAVLPRARGGKPVDLTADEDGIYPVAALDKPPTIVGGSAALRAAVVLPDSVDAEGLVEVEFVVGTDGTVRDPQVIGEADPVLSTAAKDALLRSRYVPGMKAGKPVECRMRVTVPVGRQ